MWPRKRNPQGFTKKRGKSPRGDARRRYPTLKGALWRNGAGRDRPLGRSCKQEKKRPRTVRVGSSRSSGPARAKEGFLSSTREKKRLPPTPRSSLVFEHPQIEISPNKKKGLSGSRERASVRTTKGSPGRGVKSSGEGEGDLSAGGKKNHILAPKKIR